MASEADICRTRFATMPAELHIYAGSGHGFGFRPPSTINPQLSTTQKPAGKWIERFEEWLADSGFLKKP